MRRAKTIFVDSKDQATFEASDFREARDEGVLQRSAGELLDMVEDWEESRVQGAEVRHERVA